jgi:hypothetical protein
MVYGDFQKFGGNTPARWASYKFSQFAIYRQQVFHVFLRYGVISISKTIL